MTGTSVMTSSPWDSPGGRAAGAWPALRLGDRARGPALNISRQPHLAEGVSSF